MSGEKWFTTHFLPHGHRKTMSTFLFPSCTLLVKIFHAEHLESFFKDQPLYRNPIIDKEFCVFWLFIRVKAFFKFMLF